MDCTLHYMMKLEQFDNEFHLTFSSCIKLNFNELYLNTDVFLHNQHLQLQVMIWFNFGISMWWENPKFSSMMRKFSWHHLSNLLVRD